MAFFWACSNTSTGTLNSPNNGSNSGGSTVTSTYYSKNIQPIFTASCSGSTCHIPGPQSGVTLSDFSHARGSVGNQYGVYVINPGNAAGSPIIDKISNANPKHGVRMPFGGSPLSQDKIDTLKAWINRGAKENS